MNDNNNKRPVGRPSKFSPELLAKAKEYVHIYETLGDVIPSVERLALYLQLSRETIYRWCKEEGKEEFRDTLEEINIEQRLTLLNKGLSGDFNSNICKLALGNHGFTEKNQTEISGPNGKAIEQKWEIEFINSDKKDNK